MLRSVRTLLLVLALGLALPLGLLGIAPPGSQPETGAGAAEPETVAPATSVMADYDPLRAGHPLRIIAYALHPVGVILDYAILRPAYWLGSHEPLRTLVGREH